jgi:hypothetical protein
VWKSQQKFNGAEPARNWVDGPDNPANYKYLTQEDADAGCVNPGYRGAGETGIPRVPEQQAEEPTFPTPSPAGDARPASMNPSPSSVPFGFTAPSASEQRNIQRAHEKQSLHFGAEQSATEIAQDPLARARQSVANIQMRLDADSHGVGWQIDSRGGHDSTQAAPELGYRGAEL